MNFYDSKGRPVDILETDGGYEEAYVVSAVYLDTLTSAHEDMVPDDELDHLTEAYSECITDNEYQKLVSAAEDAFEGDR